MRGGRGQAGEGSGAGRRRSKRAGLGAPVAGRRPGKTGLPVSFPLPPPPCRCTGVLLNVVKESGSYNSVLHTLFADASGLPSHSHARSIRRGRQSGVCPDAPLAPVVGARRRGAPEPAQARDFLELSVPTTSALGARRRRGHWAPTAPPPLVVSTRPGPRRLRPPPVLPRGSDSSRQGP